MNQTAALPCRDLDLLEVGRKKTTEALRRRQLVILFWAVTDLKRGW